MYSYFSIDRYQETRLILANTDNRALYSCMVSIYLKCSFFRRIFHNIISQSFNVINAQTKVSAQIWKSGNAGSLCCQVTSRAE